MGLPKLVPQILPRRPLVGLIPLLNWLLECGANVLLETLNKRGNPADQRYLAQWISARTFHWQTPNKTTPATNRRRHLRPEGSPLGRQMRQPRVQTRCALEATL